MNDPNTEAFRKEVVMMLRRIYPKWEIENMIGPNLHVFTTVATLRTQSPVVVESGSGTIEQFMKVLDAVEAQNV